MMNLMSWKNSHFAYTLVNRQLNLDQYTLDNFRRQVYLAFDSAECDDMR